MKTMLSTIQKRENLNTVHRGEECGPGGAYHYYEIRCDEPAGGDLTNPLFLSRIIFQKGARKDPEATHGVLDVDLLEIVRDRLQCFQKGAFATRENAIALTHIEEALLWMNKRVEDRIERGVLGTYEK